MAMKLLRKRPAIEDSKYRADRGPCECVEWREICFHIAENFINSKGLSYPACL